MKRSAALTPLSHDHQHGLAVALELSRATDATAAAAAAAFAAFWSSEGRHHFRVEEEVLLPAMARHHPADHDAVVRVLVDHTDIRRRACDLEAADSPSPDDLHELGRRLREHIRHEERVLFPLAEETLPPGELEALAARIANA